MSTSYLYGTGRRKEAVARVRLLPGDGSIVVNGKDAADYFGGTPGLAERIPGPTVAVATGRNNPAKALGRIQLVGLGRLGHPGGAGRQPAGAGRAASHAQPGLRVGIQEVDVV